MIGVILLVPAGLLALFGRRSAWVSWSQLVLPLIGWVLFTLGTSLRVWSTLYIGAQKRSILITDGPYSLCRNPLYLGSFFVALSAGLFLQSILFTGAVVLAGLAYVCVTVPAEERVLRATHGSVYDAYCQKTARFWPRFSCFRSPAIIEVRVHGLRLEFKRLLVWVWLPVLAQLLAYARLAHWWPVLFPSL